MRVKAATPIIIIGFIIAIFSSFTAIAVIDAPHNASNNISCGSCHGEALHYSAFWGGSFTPYDIDDTPYNRICLSRCHTAPFGPYTDTNAPLVKTHSSLNTSNKYGDWTRECRTCHDPHYQKQKNYKNTDASNLYLATGTITRCDYNPPVPPEVVGTSTLTYSTDPQTPFTYKSGWYSPPEDDPDKKYLTKKTSDYRRTILFPNVGKLGYNYPIIGVDEGAKTITVTGDARAYLYPPTTFAVIYGQYVKDSIDIKADPSVSPPPASIYKTVKFFDKADTKSFADGDSTYNGVCEVCHTTTIFHTNIGDGTNHFDAQNCTTCHPHIEGFKPSCKGCHGYPPPPLATLGAGPTGSTTAGAHVLHVTTKGYQCSICHYNSTGSGATHNNNIITLGFVSLLGAYTGGSYDGQTSANYQNSDAGTTVSKTGNKQCSNIYCHGGTMASNGGTAQAVWDNPSSAACGTCHGATAANPPLRGSHQKHAGPGLQLPCSDCHNGYVPSTIPSGMATHVNNEANFAFDISKNNIGGSASYNGTPTMLDAYGYCSSTYCHGSGTPQWGATSTNADCTWCHGGNAASAVPITLVNHPAHMNQASVLGTNYECAQCHNTTVSAGNDRLITGTVHANGTKDVSMLMGGTWTAGTAICSSVYCHSSGKGTYVNPPAWGSPTNLGCNGCHGTSNAIGWPDYANEGAGLPNANSHISHVTTSADCNTCHTNTTTTGTAIKTGSILHTNQALDVNFDTTKAGGSATWTAGTKTCSNISCHCDTNAQWGQTLTCIDCHSGSCGSRAAITPQFSANSHHIQGATLTSALCYQCHWEANSDGTINHTYHGGSAAPDAAVDLVIYLTTGELTQRRPTTYTLDVTAKQYTANDAVNRRVQLAKINTHCLSCHNTQNSTITPITPFGDGKTPNYYAWDGTSIDAKYSQTGTTTWGKYTAVICAVQKNITKAYSAHGKAMLNGGGRSTDVGDIDSGGCDDGYFPNTRNGSENVACFDCHNSHGSTVSGITTSYTSATTNGGILKDVVANTGGYTMTYQPQAGGSTEDRNVYNAGAGLCFDCHINATSGTTPWGYNGTFGATQTIMGYRDTPYFGPGISGPQQRFGYKLSNSNKGGHFGASSPLTGLPGFPPPDKTTINGLCTPCHDPHGVSPTLGTNMQYSVPLLKGTWLTSPYREDKAPANDLRGTIRLGRREGVQYFIDQNTFGRDGIWSIVTGITQTDTQFAGLCLNCHPKNSLTDEVNGGTWKSVDRIHESVKGWGANVKHNYPCSKCHTPHNSRLPRLMVTDCLDKRHKGRVNNNLAPRISGSGSGNGTIAYVCECNGPSKNLGFCPLNNENPNPEQKCFLGGNGSGSGRFPGSWGGLEERFGVWYYSWDYGITCHENNNSNQEWNEKTQWYDDTPVITSGPSADNFRAVGTNIKADITWTTDKVGTSYVDYGLTSDYGSTTENDTMVTSHSITLTNLKNNHSTYHYRVRSTGPLGTETISGDNTFYVSIPPSVPAWIHEPNTDCIEPCSVMLVWNASTNPDSDPVGYNVRMNDTFDFSSPKHNWDWISERDYCDDATKKCRWTVPVPLETGKTWWWEVQARDEYSVSGWPVNPDFFTISTNPPPAPILIDQPNTVGVLPLDVTLNWNAVTYGEQVEYHVEVDDDPGFGSYIESGWITGTNWPVTLSTATTWYWRVQTRHAKYTTMISSWSTVDSFTVYPLIINESFEMNPGYDNEPWTETVGTNCSLTPDSALPATLSGAGSWCLRSISAPAASNGYNAFTTKDLGSEQPKTFTSFYLYVEAEGLDDGNNKRMGALITGASKDVFIFKLNQNSGQLRFNLRLVYNNGSSWNDYFANISLNTWYKIEVKYDTTNPGAADAWEWRFDGVFQNGSNLTSLTGGYYSGIQRWMFGFDNSNQAYTGTVYYDLVRVNTLTFY